MAPAPSWRQRFDSPLARLLVLAILIIFLMIPVSMIKGVVHERQERRAEAVRDIEAKWGGAQTVIGPILRVPFVVRSYISDTQDRRIEQTHLEAAYFLPKRLSINGQTRTEIRQRGIFEVPVYAAQLKLEGQFEVPDFSSWGVAPEDVDWSRAELMLSLSQPRALSADADIVWNGQRMSFKPSTGQNGAWTPPGVHVPLTGQQLQSANGKPLTFTIVLGVQGADALNFAPAAENTEVTLSADWPHPSFQGSWLPSKRALGLQGFSAHWSVSYLGRGYPQRWRETSAVEKNLHSSVFGVRLANPVDNYSMADRITKYALMTLVFTFAVIWLTEILSGARAHAIQYGFVGAALCLFGLLQLSFAEHFGFAAAYAVAACAVTLLVTLYSRSVLKNSRRALVVGGVQAGLYGYLYMILQAEDYALLGGALALFIGLACAMYLTRRINWFAAEPEAAPLTSA